MKFLHQIAEKEQSATYKPIWVQKAFRQCSQAYGVILGVSYAGPGAGLDDTDECLLTQLILRFSAVFYMS